MVGAFHLKKSSPAAGILLGVALLWGFTARSAPAGGGADPKTGHWAFQPPGRREVPSVRRGDWPANPIDYFILAQLERHQLGPSADADKETLLRRVTFDLTGLPPTPAARESFLTDASPAAYERLVDRLLASEHYGERWGKHWLDTVGYADSNGYFDADTDRPLAWKYRDYVVDAFNQNKPLDRFIMEQLAGDEMAGYVPDRDVTPEMVGLLTATHLLRNAPDGTGESDGNPQELRADRYAVLEGNVQILGSVFLGLTVQCARCHDHKFEPVTQSEYYQLQAILKPVYNHDQWVKPADRTVTVGTKEARETNRRAIEKYKAEIKALKESQEGLLQPLRKLVQEERLGELAAPLKERIVKAFETKEKERDERMKSVLKENEKLLQVTEEDLVGRFPQFKEPIQQVKALLAAEEKNEPAKLPQIAAVTEVTPGPKEHHLLKRGDYGTPLEAVGPGVPAVLCAGQENYRVAQAGSGAASGRRLALARWITSPKHPTCARLMVNRIWQGHFGTGLVRSTDNFGVTGARPTHPELLDYLAADFVASAWDVKRLHRLIVLSHAYRQSAALREGPFQADPENQWLWRYPVRRLEAECIRDAMLSVSGELDPKMGGPYTPCRRNDEGQVVPEEGPNALRRSLYLQQRRTALPAGLEVFDYPQMNPNCSKRNSSTVSLQSLYLLNSDFARRRSSAMARRVEREGGASDEARVEYAFRLAVGRDPEKFEQEAAREFLAAQAAVYPAGSKGKAWDDFCQMLMASSAFLYLE